MTAPHAVLIARGLIRRGVAFTLKILKGRKYKGTVFVRLTVVGQGK